MVKMERATAARFFDLLLLHKGCQEYWNDYKFSQKGTDLRNFPEIYNKSQKTFCFFFVLLFSYLQAVVHRCLTRRQFWKILQNSQKNICAGVSFLIIFEKVLRNRCMPVNLTQTRVYASVCLWNVDFLRTPPNNCFEVFLFLVVLNTATPTLMHFTTMEWFKTFKESCLKVQTV